MTHSSSIQDIVEKSGHNFHCQVVNFLRENGWTALISPYYNDNFTEKPREVDIIAEWGGKLKAVEIKMGTTFKPEFISNLSYFSVFAQEAEKYLIYQGEQEGKILDVTLTPVKKVRSFIF